MRASVLIDYLATGDCSKLAIADVGDMDLNPDPTPSALQLTNQAKFVNYVNLANLAVHKRFNLLKKNFELDSPTDGEEYTLPSTFLAPIYAYYTADSDPVTIRDSYVNLRLFYNTPRHLLRLRWPGIIWRSAKYTLSLYLIMPRIGPMVLLAVT